MSWEPRAAARGRAPGGAGKAADVTKTKWAAAGNPVADDINVSCCCCCCCGETAVIREFA